MKLNIFTKLSTRICIKCCQQCTTGFGGMHCYGSVYSVYNKYINEEYINSRVIMFDILAINSGKSVFVFL